MAFLVVSDVLKLDFSYIKFTTPIVIKFSQKLLHISRKKMTKIHNVYDVTSNIDDVISP